MPGPTFGDYESLADPLVSPGYRFRFGPVFGLARSTRNLSLKCTSLRIPSTGDESYDVSLFGYTARHRGKSADEHQIQAMFYEDRLMDSYATLYTWRQIVCNSQTGNSAAEKYSVEDIPGYATSASADLYDSRGARIAEFAFYGFYPERVEEITVQSGNTEGVSVGAVFSFDLMRPLVLVPSQRAAIEDFLRGSGIQLTGA